MIVVLLGASFSSVLRGGDPFSPGTKTFTANGIELSYPAGWNVNDQGWASSGLGSTFAILGTQPWGLCLPFDINCHYEIKLEPSQISVALGSGIVGGGSVCDIGVDRSDLAGRGAGDPPATGRLLRVAGRPTLATDYAVGQLDYYRSDAWRTWVIAAPGSTTAVYRIDARYRGPGDSAFSRQLDDMIAGMRFVGPATRRDGGPDDCGSPFP
ncbi:MAG: hypothetical protein NVS9B8_03890 [Candidatus Limnocylindrales bacterium]